MARNPAQFSNDYSEVQRLIGHLHADELFNGQSEPEIHVHSRKVVHAVGIGDVLWRAEVFTDLFRTPVQIPDVWRAFVNDLAVRAEQQPKHTVSTGVLRAHIHEHFVRLNVELDHPRIFNHKTHFKTS